MQAADVILVIEAFMWLLVGSIPFLVGLVLLSCWARNRAHREKHEQLEQLIFEQLQTFSQTGQWPQAHSHQQRKALKVLAKRLDLNESALVVAP